MTRWWVPAPPEWRRDSASAADASGRCRDLVHRGSARACSSPSLARRSRSRDDSRRRCAGDGAGSLSTRRALRHRTFRLAFHDAPSSAWSSEGCDARSRRSLALVQVVRLEIYGAIPDAISREALRALPPGVVDVKGRIERDPKTGESGRDRVLGRMNAVDCLLLLHGTDLLRRIHPLEALRIPSDPAPDPGARVEEPADVANAHGARHIVRRG